MRKTPDPRTELPLKPIVFRILLLLVEGERHGYSLVKAPEKDEHSKKPILPGNLYRSLNAMMSKGFIESSQRRRDPDLDDQRRRYFVLTPFGRAVARAEAERLEGLVVQARAQRLLSKS